MAGTQLAGGFFISGTGPGASSPNGVGGAASEEELREREIAALERELESIAWRLSQLEDRRKSRVDLRREGLKRQQAAVHAKLRELGVKSGSRR